MQNAIENQLGLQNLQILRSNLIQSEQGKMFLKYGDEDLVNGEYESLKAIQATGTIMCPKPIGIVKEKDSTALITSYIDFQHRKDWGMLGHQLGKMHMKNSELLAQNLRRSSFLSGSSCGSWEGGTSDEDPGFHFSTENFGFHVPTCCGRLPQDNTWTENWPDFFLKNRLKPQIDRLIEHFGDRELLDIASGLYCKTEKLLSSRKNIVPSLIHGDLWGGNWSMTRVSEDPEEEVVPVIFDPSASYSDADFEFGIMSMFGGWTPDFEREYDKVVGGAKEEKEQRVALYKLYHNLNHWNHFGGSYKTSSIALIKEILKY